MKFDTDQLYVKSTEQALVEFKEMPTAVSNTVKIAEACTLELALNKTYLPQFKVPEGGSRVKPRRATRDGRPRRALKERRAPFPDRLSGPAEGRNRGDLFDGIRGLFSHRMGHHQVCALAHPHGTGAAPPRRQPVAYASASPTSIHWSTRSCSSDS